MDAASPRGSALGYWLVVLGLLLLGLLAIFSIGLYFWFLAAGLIVLSPFRSRPNVFLPGLALFLGLLFGYVLVAPWGCSQTFSSGGGVEVTTPVVCTSPTGIEYSGDEPFDPDRTPALITGVVTGVVGAGITWLLVRRGHRLSPRHGPGVSSFLML
jgi:hypothetical protein